MLRRSLAAASMFAALGSPTAAHALGVPTIYDNYQMVPIGSRAAGMGGAYTALSCDEAALHYNVASLSCSGSSHLELSANAYVIQGALARGSLGTGEDISAATYHSIPSIVGAVRVLKKGEERTRVATYPKRLTFGFSVSLPTSLALRIDPPHPNKRDYAAFSIRDDLTAGDIGLGYQVDQALALGFSLGAVLRTAEQHASWLLVRNETSPCGPGSCNDYVAYDDTKSTLAVGFRAKVGVLYRPIRHVTFGLQLTSPTLHVYGNARDSSTVTRATGLGYQALPMRSVGSSQVGMPFRIALGSAYVRSRYTLSADVSVNFPHEAKVAYDARAEEIGGLPPPPGVPDLVLSRDWQPNLNLGAGVPFGPTKELNIGFFTDISAVSQKDRERYGSDRVHMFGGSMTVGILGKQSRAWVGLSAEIGSTTTKVPGRAFGYQAVAAAPVGVLPVGGESTLVRWTVSGILGSNYSFLE
jgi:hypothetical protein